LSEGGAVFFPRRSTEALGGVLQRALERHGLSRWLDRQVLMAAWRDAAGEELALRAQPTSLCGATLHLLVQDHRWRDQIDALRAMLLERLNRRLGRRAVRDLQYGQAHEGALRRAVRAAPAIPATESGPVVEAAVPGAEVLPEGLRDAVQRAALAAARRRLRS
jgi:predicted nucleic acid-binding Zn ribbon protein